MLLSQVRRGDGGIQIVAREGTEAYELATQSSLYDLAMECAASDQGLKARVLDLGLRCAVDVGALCGEGRMLPPLVHPDPAHLLITGTSGTRHDWFEPGTGDVLIGPGAPVAWPGEFGDAAGIAGVYVIGPEGAPYRVGFVLANAFSDHPPHRQDNVRWDHARLHQASFGPELLVGPLPGAIGGRSRLRRDDETVAEVQFEPGMQSMSLSIATLERDLFGFYARRRPGDVRIHIFGTVSLPVAEGFALVHGDVFETEAAPFGLPLWNPLSAPAGALTAPHSIHVL